MIPSVLHFPYVLASIAHFSLVVIIFYVASQDRDSISLCSRCEMLQDEFEISRHSALKVLEVIWESIQSLILSIVYNSSLFSHFVLSLQLRSFSFLQYIKIQQVFIIQSPLIVNKS